MLLGLLQSCLKVMMNFMVNFTVAILETSLRIDLIRVKHVSLSYAKFDIYGTVNAFENPP